MEYTLAQIADYAGAKVCGDPTIRITGIGSLDDASAGQITFLANPKYAAKVETTGASAIILPPGAATYGRNVIVTGNPYLVFAKVLTLFHGKQVEAKGIMDGAFVAEGVRCGSDVTVYPGAYIAPGVSIGDRVTIYPGAVIYEGVTIGDDVTIHSHVSIREYCRIGNRVTIHNGTVIGADGFGYVPDGKQHFKIPQIGIVVIGDDVEIGANTAVDRASLHVTRISNGVKIDNLVQVAHNCEIGENTVIAGQTGIAGSSRIGKNVTAGGQVAIADHINICDNVMFGARTGIMTHIERPGVYSGLPAMNHREWLRVAAVMTKLPELKRHVNDLEKRIAELEQQLAADDRH